MRKDRFARVLTAVTLIGACVLMGALAAPLFKGEVYNEDDLRAYHLPMRDFYQKSVVAGDSFLWNPNIFNGFYLHGEGQIGMLHPLKYVLYRFLPLTTAFMLELLSSYPIMFLGMFLFLRRHRLARFAALFGALLYTFVGVNMNHYIHMHFVATLAHLPWILYALDIGMRSAHRRIKVSMLLVVLALSASQLLLVSAQYTFVSLVIEGVYLLYLLVVTRNISFTFAVLGAHCLAIATTAAQLLPTMDVLAHSYRAAPDIGFKTSMSMHPLNLLQLFNPYLFHRRVFAPFKGDEPWDAIYLGAVATVLLVYVIFCVRPWGKNRGVIIAFLFLVPFGTLMALGGYAFLYPLLAELPIVDKLRAPARYVAIVHAGMAVVAAFGMAHLGEAIARGQKTSWWKLAPIFLVAVASLVVTGAFLSARYYDAFEGFASVRYQMMPTSALLIGCAVVCAAACLLIVAARGSALALIALVLLTLVDVGLYSLRHKPTGDLAMIRNEIQGPPAAPFDRIDPDIHPMTMNRYGMLDFRCTYGYVSLLPARRLDYTQVLPLRLAGVTWREARLSGSRDVHEAAVRGEGWVRLSNPLPRARLVSEVRVSETPLEDLERIDIETVGLVGGLIEVQKGPPGDATIVLDRPGRIEVQTSAKTKQLLIVSESYHEGWQATIGGSPEAVLAVYGDFIGCVVGPGDQVVEFIFAPESFRWGKIISVVAGIASFVYLVLLYLWWAPRTAKSRDGVGAYPSR